MIAVTAEQAIQILNEMLPEKMSEDYQGLNELVFFQQYDDGKWDLMSVLRVIFNTHRMTATTNGEKIRRFVLRPAREGARDTIPCPSCGERV